ncbi:hypothetical protein ASD76_14950 [Altererythrobacter sp. Root672]|nr:hypothetical protein ASD76_14950 [Altererythrobacter sp. Root672]
MVNDLISSQPLVDERGAAFGRLVSRVLEALNDAVDYRRSEGVTASSIAEKLGCHKSVISRVLSGATRNLTLRTISDILWAVEFDPKDFQAEPIESLASICTIESELSIETVYWASFSYPTQTMSFDRVLEIQQFGSAVRKPEIAMAFQ